MTRMIHRLAILGALALACTNTTGPSTGPSTHPGGTTIAEEDASPTTTSPSTPYHVMLGGLASRTEKPVPNTLLAHSWGWASATEATIRECEANATSVGQQMWCSTEDKPPGAAKLLRSLKLGPGESAFVTPEQIATWKIPTPPSAIWLIGTTTICEAELGRPLVGFYTLDGDGDEEEDDDDDDDDDEEEEEAEEEDDEDDDDEDDEDDEFVGDVDLSEPFTIVELGWELTGCEITDPAAWSPIAITAPPEPGLRWQPAETGPLERFDPSTWTGPLAAELTTLPSEAASELGIPSEAAGPVWWTRTHTIPGTTIEQRYIAALWRAPESERKPDEWGCGDYEYPATFLTRTEGSATILLEAQLPLETPGRTLTGALVGANQARLLVWDDDYDYAAAWLTDHLGDKLDLPTGVYHPEAYDGTGDSLIGYCGP